MQAEEGRRGFPGRERSYIYRVLLLVARGSSSAAHILPELGSRRDSGAHRGSVRSRGGVNHHRA